LGHSSAKPVGYPLHVIGPDGRISRSFGSETGVFRSDVPGSVARSIARSVSSSMWSAHQSSYMIDLIDIDTGLITKRIERVASWFPPGEKPRTAPRPAMSAPMPQIGAIQVAADRLREVFLNVPDSRWRSAVTLAVGAKHPTVIDADRITDAILEVIDVRRGTLVASMRVDRTPATFVAPGLMRRADTSATGASVIRIERAALTNPQRK